MKNSMAGKAAAIKAATSIQEDIPEIVYMALLGVPYKDIVQAYHIDELYNLTPPFAETAITFALRGYHPKDTGKRNPLEPYTGLIDEQTWREFSTRKKTLVGRLGAEARLAQRQNPRT